MNSTATQVYSASPQRRAEAVRRYLTGIGVRGERRPGTATLDAGQYVVRVIGAQARHLSIPALLDENRGLERVAVVVSCIDKEIERALVVMRLEDAAPRMAALFDERRRT